MAYIPDWEQLADALKRVMATGLSEDEAKTDLCGAIADRKIHVRVRIAQNGDYGMRGRFFSTGRVRAPPLLAVGDLDWAQSRPLKPWFIGPIPGDYFWFEGAGDRPLDLILLSTADVLEMILCCESNSGVSLAANEQETAAIAIIQALLEGNEHLTKDAAKACLDEKQVKVSDDGFQHRVWPLARIKAGLPPVAAGGRKPVNRK